MTTHDGKVAGTMGSDNEEKVDGLSVIQTSEGAFVAFADPQQKPLMALAPQMREILLLLRDTLSLNKEDMQPGIYHSLQDIIARALPHASAPASDKATTDSMREEYERVQYNVYACGANAKRYERKAAAARKDHTRNAWQKKADEERDSQQKNQQRLVILEAQMQAHAAPPAPQR